jgi:UDP-2-acetamido-3-amino-2,3-dideoxy-glucuronate N-acetyltransferase
MKKDFWAHPTAIIDTDQIGDGTRIWAFTHIMENVIVGANCKIGEHCFIESGAVIGDNVTIKNQTLIWDGVCLQNGVFIGPRVTFTNDRYPRSPRLTEVKARYEDKEWLRFTCVEEGASIGASATILPGLTIGRYGMVGAGSLVTKAVPPYRLVLGNPAIVHGWVCRCGRPLKLMNERASCEECGEYFQTVNGRLTPVTAPASEESRMRFMCSH